MNVFADDITIEDDMSVLVRYDNGANMTYHLTAYSVSLLLSPLPPSFPSTLFPFLPSPVLTPVIDYLQSPSETKFLFILTAHVTCLPPTPGRVSPITFTCFLPRSSANISHGKDTGSCSTATKVDWSSK
jgi:hypothetical protein